MEKGDELQQTARELFGRRSLRFATRIATPRHRVRGHAAVGSLLDPVQTGAPPVDAAELLQATLELAGRRSMRLVTGLANLGSRFRGRPRVGSVLDPLIDTLVEIGGAPSSHPRSAPVATPEGGRAKEAPQLDVVVLVSGDGTRVAETLAGLDHALSLIDGVVAFVDDGANEGAMSLAEGWAAERDIAATRVESDPVPGLSRSFRRGLEAGEADAILIVTAGVLPLPGACESLLRELTEHRTALAVSGLRIPTAPGGWVPPELAAAAADSRLGPGTVSSVGGVRVAFCVLRREFLEDHAFNWFVKERRRDRALHAMVSAAKQSRRSLLQTAAAAAVIDPVGTEEIRLDPHEERLTEALRDLVREPRKTADVLEAALSRPLQPARVLSNAPVAAGVRDGLRALGVNELEDGAPHGVAFAFDPPAAEEALGQSYESVVLCEAGELLDGPREEIADALREGRLRVTAPTRVRRRGLEMLGWPVAGLVPVPVLGSVFKPREDDPLLGAVRCVVVRTGDYDGGRVFARSLAADLGPGVAVLTLGPPLHDTDPQVALMHRAEGEPSLAASTLGAADLFVDLGTDDHCGTWTARALCCGAPVLAVRGSSGAELVGSEPALIVPDREALAPRLASLLADHHELLRLRSVAEALAERHGEVSVAARLLAVAVLR